MNEHNIYRDDTSPWYSPQTDPTNPFRQESTGLWEAAERANERRKDEPGLTERDRAEREPNA